MTESIYHSIIGTIPKLLYGNLKKTFYTPSHLQRTAKIRSLKIFRNVFLLSRKKTRCLSQRTNTDRATAAYRQR
jgi:arginyl-tRNA--protein-N-Asp/Glu arginylyltransferase